MNIQYLADMYKISDYNADKKFKITLGNSDPGRYDFQTMLNITNLPIEYFDREFISIELITSNGRMIVERI